MTTFVVKEFMLFAATILLASGTGFEIATLAEKLENLKTVSFDYERVLHYKSEGFQHKMTVRSTIEFGPKWKPIQCRFRMANKSLEEVFDGMEYRHVAEGKAPITQKGPSGEYFSSILTLKNSLIGLAAALRQVIKLGAKVHEVTDPAGKIRISFELKNLEIGVHAPLLDVEYSPKYEITIDSKTGLPATIVQFLKNRNDTITTRFSNYKLEATVFKSR